MKRESKRGREEKVVVAAGEASTEIPETALIWASTQAVQPAGDCVTPAVAVSSESSETNGINKHKKLLGAAPDSIREKLSNNPPIAPQRHHRRRRCDNAGGWISTFWNKYFKVDLEWLTQSRGLLLVLATLMLCMSYQATMHVLSSLPGGVWQGSGNDDKIFALWIVLHSVGFMGSCSTIMLVLCGLPNRNKVYVWLLAFTFYIAVTCIAATYGLALFKVGLAYFNHILPHIRSSGLR